MTIIVGYQPPGSGEVWMAADRRVSSDSFIYPAADRKIRRVGEWLIGCGGSSRLDEFFDDRTAGWTSVKALRDEFVAWLKELGLEPEDERKGDVPSYRYGLLAARAGELVEVASDGALIRPSWGFLALGDGYAYAYGAAHALLDPFSVRRDYLLPRPQAAEVVFKSVEAAISLCATCGGEIDIESVGGDR